MLPFNSGQNIHTYYENKEIFKNKILFDDIKSQRTETTLK